MKDSYEARSNNINSNYEDIACIVTTNWTDSWIYDPKRSAEICWPRTLPGETKPEGLWLCPNRIHYRKLVHFQRRRETRSS